MTLVEKVAREMHAACFYQAVVGESRWYPEWEDLNQSGRTEWRVAASAAIKAVSEHLQSKSKE